MKKSNRKIMENLKNNPLKVVRVDKHEFELDNGDGYFMDIGKFGSVFTRYQPDHRNYGDGLYVSIANFLPHYFIANTVSVIDVIKPTYDSCATYTRLFILGHQSRIKYEVINYLLGHVFASCIFRFFLVPKNAQRICGCPLK